MLFVLLDQVFDAKGNIITKAKKENKLNNSDVVLVLKIISSKQKLSSFVGLGGQRWDAKRKTQTEDVHGGEKCESYRYALLRSLGNLSANRFQKCVT